MERRGFLRGLIAIACAPLVPLGLAASTAKSRWVRVRLVPNSKLVTVDPVVMLNLINIEKAIDDAYRNGDAKTRAKILETLVRLEAKVKHG